MRVAPTGRGVGLVGAGALALLAAYGFGTQALVPIGVGLAALPLLALGLVAGALSGLWPTRSVRPAAVRAGDALQVRTGTRRIGLGALAGLTVARVDPHADALGPTLANREDGLVIRARRGEHVLAPPTLAISDPFGLARGFRRGTTSAEVVVLPRIVPLPPPGRLLRVAWAHEGRRGASGWGDLDRVREYRRGDPIARIHWRQTAKRGELHTKVLQGSDGRRAATALVLDATGDGGGHAFEEAVTVVASLASAIAEGGAEPVLLLACDEGAGRANRPLRGRVVDRALAGVEAAGEIGLVDAVGAATAASAAGGVVLVTARPRGDLRQASQAAGGRLAVVLLGAAAARVGELRAAGVPAAAAADARALSISTARAREAA